MKLKGKTALVTGGSRGIGRAVCEFLGREGADVAVNYVSNAEAAQGAVEAVASAGGSAVAVMADVADPEAVARMFAEINAAFGGVDILVNNAGVWRGGKLSRLCPADWNKVFDVNLKGMLLCTQYALKTMTARGGGKIINISSVIGLTGYPGDTVYGASKAGIIGFTKSLAKEVAKNGINVNAVAPGIIATDMNAALEEKTRNKLVDSIPLGYLGKPEDIAEVVSFLACGAGYVTGQVWAVDGGYTMVS